MFSPSMNVQGSMNIEYPRGKCLIEKIMSKKKKGTRENGEKVKENEVH